MIKNVICLIILTFLCVGCGNKNKQQERYTKEQIDSLKLGSTKILRPTTDSVIDINLNPFLGKKSFDFGTMVQKIKLIPLETTNESLIAEIYKVIATDSNIYIMDNFKGAGLIIFDHNGKFIKRIQQGQGPQELLRLYDIAFDNEHNELIAYQHSFLVYFTPKGEFIRKKRLPLGFYNLAVIPEGYIFKAIEQQNDHLDNFNDFSLLVTDTAFTVKYAGLPMKESQINLGGYNYLYQWNNSEVSVTHHYNDTIFQYETPNNILKARYVINYRKKKLPDNYLDGGMQQFEEATRNNDYYFYLGKYLETEDLNVVFLENDIRGETVIYRNKKSGNTIGGSNANYNIYEIPPVAFPVSTDGKYLISYVLPDNNVYNLLSNSSLISKEDKLKLYGLTEEDNPVMVFFQLKDF
jgi:hypothetical protein